MIRHFILLLLLVLTVGAKGQTNSAIQSEAILENALLWEISGSDLSEPSYLFGTIHIIDKESYFLPSGTEEVFDKSDKVAFEIDLEDAMTLTSQLSLMMKAIMNDGTTLKDLLNEEEYKIVDNHFTQMGMPMFLLERVKPMFLSILASGDMSPDYLQSGELVSYEMEFMEMASKSDKEVHGLETAEYQMSMFDSIPYEVQAQMLVESIQAEDTGNDELEEIVEIYKNQDINAMHTMIKTDDEGIGDYEDLLLVNRNKNWIPVMAQLMESGSTFFAVGAGHLGGPSGVIKLLMEQGYTLKAVK